MTEDAIGWESSGRMVGVVGLLVVAQVAVDAVRRQTLEDVARMAGIARLGRMGRHQRVDAVGVPSFLPGWISTLVAGLAIGVEARRAVIRVARLLIVLAVAVDTLARESLVDAARVAPRTIEGGVGTEERECRVIEGRLPPATIGRAVAQLAVGWESGRDVVGVICSLIVPEVAPDTVRGCPPIETPSHVA